MRLLCCCALAVVLAACGADPAPPAAAPPSPPSAAPPLAQPVSADPGLAAVAAEMFAATATAAEQERAAQRATNTVTELIATAAGADAVAQGRAPAAIMALGNAALPGLAKGLAHENVTHRRIAVATLLQWSDSLHAQGATAPILAALVAARSDQDPAVRAAAEHAWRRATGDTSALDKSRAAHEAAERAGR